MNILDKMRNRFFTYGCALIHFHVSEGISGVPCASLIYYSYREKRQSLYVNEVLWDMAIKVSLDGERRKLQVMRANF